MYELNVCIAYEYILYVLHCMYCMSLKVLVIFSSRGRVGKHFVRAQYRGWGWSRFGWKAVSSGLWVRFRRNDYVFFVALGS